MMKWEYKSGQKDLLNRFMGKPIKQRLIIVCLVLVFLSVVFPPWSYKGRPCGYGFIGNPPICESGYRRGSDIDLKRLLLQFVGIAAIAGIGIVLTNRK